MTLDINYRDFRIIQWILQTIAGDHSEGSDTSNIWKKLMKDKFARIDDYYEIWRALIRKACTSNSILPNGWAFSTIGGISVYENFISSENTLHTLYRNRSRSITDAVNSISEATAGGRLGGVMIYGYGNLARESQLVESLVAGKLLNLGRQNSSKVKVYLFDCSVMYHVIAESKFNPLLNHVPRKQMQAELLDFITENDSITRYIKNLRGYFNPMMPVLHVFFGNTFCNLEEEDIRRIVSSYCLPTDLILAEYATFPPNFADDLKNDYASEMAKSAAKEIFRELASDISVRNVKHGSSGKCVEISISLPNGEQLKFRSMLRKPYTSSVLADKDFTHLKKFDVAAGRVFSDLYQRLIKP